MNCQRAVEPGTPRQFSNQQYQIRSVVHPEHDSAVNLAEHRGAGSGANHQSGAGDQGTDNYPVDPSEHEPHARRKRHEAEQDDCRVGAVERSLATEGGCIDMVALRTAMLTRPHLAPPTDPPRTCRFNRYSPGFQTFEGDFLSFEARCNEIRSRLTVRATKSWDWPPQSAGTHGWPPSGPTATPAASCRIVPDADHAG